jgi:hypothetical protein
MSNSHWEFKIPKPHLSQETRNNLQIASIIIGIVLVVWGRGYFTGRDVTKALTPEPVTIVDHGQSYAVTIVEDGSVRFSPPIKEGTAEDYAARFLKENNIINKLPKNYQMSYWETMGIADVYCSDANKDINGIQNAMLLLWWVFLKSEKPGEGEAARQCIIYIGKNWPGMHMSEDWGGKHTKRIYEMARDWKKEK